MKIPSNATSIYQLCKELVDDLPEREFVTIREEPRERVWWLRCCDSSGDSFAVRVITRENTFTYQAMSGGKRGFRLGRQETLTEEELTEFEEQGLLNVVEE